VHTPNPDGRAALIAGLRDLADFLEANPAMPVPSRFTPQNISVVPDGDTDDERRAVVDRVAAVLGTEACDDHGHYGTGRKFGPVEYRAFAISDAAWADHKAQSSYNGCIRLDEPERPALVSVACEHCDGTGYCTRFGCETCKDWRAAAEEPGCGACGASAVRLVEKSAA